MCERHCEPPRLGPKLHSLPSADGQGRKSRAQQPGLLQARLGVHEARR